MHFERPVETNALLLQDALDGPRVPVGVCGDTRADSFDARQGDNWVHPRADVRATVPTNLIKAVLHARKLMVPQGSLLRVVSVPELCAQVAPIAYVLQARDVEIEIESRGPVMSTIPITPALLAYWSALLKGEALEPFDGTFAHVRHGSNVLGSVAVVIVGYTPEYFVVGLSWGATCDTLDAWGFNGCMRASKQLPLLLTNVVAMCDSLPPKAEGGGEIMVLPLTPAVLQHAAQHSGKLPKKSIPLPKPAVKPKLKVKANLNAGPPPPPPLLAALKREPDGKANGEETRDKAVFITLGVMCIVVMVLLSIFFATKKKVKRAPKAWTP